MAKRTLGAGFYALRFEVLQRDGFRCRYCGQYAPNVVLEVDHVIPVADGGQDTIDNLVSCCWACNRGKGGLMVRQKSHTSKARTFAEDILLLRSQPFRQQQILELLQKGHRLTTRDVAEAADIAVANAHKVLYRLQKRGLANHEGAYWFST